MKGNKSLIEVKYNRVEDKYLNKSCLDKKRKKNIYYR